VPLLLLLLLSSYLGGCVGSTCGGIKAIRFLLLYKQIIREARLLIRPTAQIAVKLGDYPVPNRVMQAVWAFYFLYIVANLHAPVLIGPRCKVSGRTEPTFGATWVFHPRL
jgi:Trk-type K+ transport system membrane component